MYSVKLWFILVFVCVLGACGYQARSVPPDVPTYPASVNISDVSDYTTMTHDKVFRTITYETNDSIKNIMGYYLDELPKYGWSRTLPNDEYKFMSEFFGRDYYYLNLSIKDNGQTRSVKINVILQRGV